MGNPKKKVTLGYALVQRKNYKMGTDLIEKNGIDSGAGKCWR